MTTDPQIRRVARRTERALTGEVSVRDVIDDLSDILKILGPTHDILALKAEGLLEGALDSVRSAQDYLIDAIGSFEKLAGRREAGRPAGNWTREDGA
jgi:hypothetical protein